MQAPSDLLQLRSGDRASWSTADAALVVKRCRVRLPVTLRLFGLSLVSYTLTQVGDCEASGAVTEAGACLVRPSRVSHAALPSDCDATGTAGMSARQSPQNMLDWVPAACRECSGWTTQRNGMPARSGGACAAC